MTYFCPKHSVGTHSSQSGCIQNICCERTTKSNKKCHLYSRKYSTYKLSEAVPLSFCRKEQLLTLRQTFPGICYGLLSVRFPFEKATQICVFF